MSLGLVAVPIQEMFGLDICVDIAHSLTLCTVPYGIANTRD